MHPQQHWLPTMFVCAKNDTRDVGGEYAVFAGSKKNAPAMVLHVVILSVAKDLLAGRLRGDSSLHSEWQHKVPLLIANYSLLIILEPHIAPRNDSP